MDNTTFLINRTIALRKLFVDKIMPAVTVEPIPGKTQKNVYIGYGRYLFEDQSYTYPIFYDEYEQYLEYIREHNQANVRPTA